MRREKKISGDLFMSLNITGWSAGCWFLGPFLCDSDCSVSVRIGLVSSIAATLPPDRAESENWSQSRERCEFKSCPNKIPTSCGACFMFRKFGTFSITFASGSTNFNDKRKRNRLVHAGGIDFFFLLLFIDFQHFLTKMSTSHSCCTL